MTDYYIFMPNTRCNKMAAISILHLSNAFLPLIVLYFLM